MSSPEFRFDNFIFRISSSKKTLRSSTISQIISHFCKNTIWPHHTFCQINKIFVELRRNKQQNSQSLDTLYVIRHNAMHNNRLYSIRSLVRNIRRQTRQKKKLLTYYQKLPLSTKRRIKFNKTNLLEKPIPPPTSSHISQSSSRLPAARNRASRTPRPPPLSRTQPPASFQGMSPPQAKFYM